MVHKYSGFHSTLAIRHMKTKTKEEKQLTWFKPKPNYPKAQKRKEKKKDCPNNSLAQS